MGVPRSLLKELLQTQPPLLWHLLDPIPGPLVLPTAAAALTQQVDRAHHRHHRQTGGQSGTVPAQSALGVQFPAQAQLYAIQSRIDP